MINEVVQMNWDGANSVDFHTGMHRLAAWHTQRQAQLLVAVVGGGSQKPGGLMRGSLAIPDDSGPVLSTFGGAVGSPREGNPKGFVPNELVPAEVP